MFQPRQSKSNFLDSMFGHSTNNVGHQNATVDRDLLETLMDEYDGDSDDNEVDIGNFKPLLREEEEKPSFDVITGAKKKTKKRKVKKIKSVEIIPVVSNAEAYGEAPHPHLLRPPFSMLIIAPKGSGKSTVSINMEKFYDGAYDNRIVFSPTMVIDDNWKAAFKKKVVKPFNKRNVFKKYNEQKLGKIWKAIKKENKPKDNFADKLKTMIMFDDIIGQLPRTRTVNAMYDIARNHRHYAVSNIIVSQEYKALAGVIRKNATGLLLFKTTDGDEIKSIVDAQGGFIGKNRFFRMWAYCISKPYGFLFINKDKSDIKEGKLDGDRYFSKFEEELDPMSFSNERVKDMLEELIILSTKSKNVEVEIEKDNKGKSEFEIEEGIKDKSIEVKKPKNIMPKELKKDIDGDGKKEIVIEEVPQENLKVCKCKMKVIKDITNICPNGLALLADALHIENTEELSKEELIKKLSKFKIKVLKLVLAREKKKLNK